MAFDDRPWRQLDPFGVHHGGVHHGGVHHGGGQHGPRPVASPRAAYQAHAQAQTMHQDVHVERTERGRPERPAPAEHAQPEPDEGDRPSGISPREGEKDALRRALRDLEAAEARVLRHAERVYDETRSKLVSELLPVLDNLDRTLRAAHVSHEGDALLQGVKMTRSQLEQVLLRYGVERIDATGQRFDPALHDAIATREADPEHVGCVVEPVEAGYRFAGRVLRAAKVIVGVAPH